MRRLSLLLLLAFGSSFAEDALPRVLVIGDMIYREPVQGAAKDLKGRAEIVHASLPAGRVLHTGLSPEELEGLLGDGKWDLIHFNFGLGDLLYRAPGMNSVRALPMQAGGVRATSPEDYEANLRAILLRLNETGAKLVWASTTPIRASSTNLFEVGSEIEYNTIAARVMAENKIPINDMHTYVRNLIDMDKPAAHGADPFFFDRKPIHPPLVEAILRHLPAR